MKKPFDRPMTAQEIAATPDADIDFSDIPELDDAFWDNARLVEPDRTQSVTLRVKKSVLDTFKAQGKGYQTRMNAVLETYARSITKPQH
nr:BrnA antitoxin family protein [uncultured Rhodopila sp.]